MYRLLLILTMAALMPGLADPTGLYVICIAGGHIALKPAIDGACVDSFGRQSDGTNVVKRDHVFGSHHDIPLPVLSTTIESSSRITADSKAPAATLAACVPAAPVDYLLSPAVPHAPAFPPDTTPLPIRTQRTTVILS